MKTKKLLSLAAAAFFGMSAYAQEPGDYFFKNVESGRYLNGANSWGTKASVTDHGQLMTLAAVDGGFTIDSHYSNGGNNHFLASGDNTFIDATPATHTLEAQADGSYAIKDSNGKYLSSDGNLVNFNSDVINGASKWLLISKADVLKAAESASETNPVDFTGFIGDANFSRNNVDFSLWLGAELSKGGANENMNAEMWGGNPNSKEFKSYQTISNLPNGRYKLSVQGFYRYNNTSDNTNDVAAAAHIDGTEQLLSVFYANNEEKALMSIADETSVLLYEKMPFSQSDARAAFEKGAYQNSLDVVVTNGTLTIGVKKEQHLGTDWTVFDNFELEYYGKVTDLSSYETAFNAAVAAATGVDQNAKMNASVLSALQSAINTYNVVFSTFTSADDVVEATNELSDAANAANASIAIYKEIAVLNAKAATLDADGQKVYASTLAAYNNGTLTTVAEAEAALVAAVKANGVLRVKADTEFTGEVSELDGKTLVLVDATSSEKLLCNIGQAQDMVAKQLSDLEGSEYLYTKFAKADVEVEGVEGDIYTMQMFNKDGNNFAKWGTNGYVNFQPADRGTIVFALGLGNGNWGQDADNHDLWTVEKTENGYTIKNVGRGTYFSHSQATATVTEPAYFKFYAETEFYKETAEPAPTPVIADLTVNDGVAVEASQDAKNITYVREFKAANKWQSLYLPFSVNLENNEADVVLAKVDDVVAEADGVVINIVKVSATETVEARKPLFIAAKTVGVKNINTGVSTISEPNDGGNEYSAAEFIGVLSEARAGYAGKYVMSGGELCLVPQSMDNLTLGVNRWAMFVSNGMGVRVRINAEGFSADEATAIASAVAESVENGEIFSINGAKVKDAKSGLYIKNGKKILVK